MRHLITEILKGILLGFWHSLRGFYRWYAYDQSKCINKPFALRKDGSDISASSQQSQPLTSLARKRLDSKEHQSQGSENVQTTRLLHALMLAFSYNGPLVLGYALWTMLEVLPHMMVSPDHYFLCHLLSIVMQLGMFMSRLLFAKGINMFLQNEIAAYVYQRALGRSRVSGYASAGSDLYASLQLQIIYYLLLSVASTLLAWFGVIGHAVSVIMATPYWSLYSFDFCWYYMGVPFQDRLTYIERNWPYFVGFGLPLALVDTVMHPLWSSFLPMFMLPFVIVSAVDATAAGNKEQVFCGSAVHFFSFPIWLSDLLHGGLVDVPRLIQYCVYCWKLRQSSRSALAGPSSQASTPQHQSTRDVSRTSGSSVRRSETPDMGGSSGAGSRRSSDVRRPPDYTGQLRHVASEETSPAFVRPHTPSQMKVASWLEESSVPSAVQRSLQFTDPPSRLMSGPPSRPPPSMSSTLTAATAVPVSRRRNFRSNLDQDLY
ncbi:hypothetical protein FHG87_001541 [Trinorchestia longiramus]|nr:hypothetical protein FHG87_001541 [Trinorchestia longiramus]